MLLCATEMTRREQMDEVGRAFRRSPKPHDRLKFALTSHKTSSCCSNRVRPAKRVTNCPSLTCRRSTPLLRWVPRMCAREIDGFPEVSEVETIRHFTRLSTWNYAIDLGLYPLGSCTMKYNPRVNELVARLDGLAWAHPYQPEALAQGAMEIMARLEAALAEITGMDAVTLQPAAGAHGELTGILLDSRTARKTR